MKKLRNQLMLSYLPLILAPVLIIALLTRNAAESGLRLDVVQGARQQAANLAQCLGHHYATYGSFDNLPELSKSGSATAVNTPPPIGTAPQSTADVPVTVNSDSPPNQIG